MTLDLTDDEYRLLMAMVDIAACHLTGRPISKKAIGMACSRPDAAHEGLTLKLISNIGHMAEVSGSA